MANSIGSWVPLKSADGSKSRTKYFYYDPLNKESLSDAIVNKDPKSVRQLLSAGSSPNVPSKYESHPLILAMGQFEIVKMLIHAGANVNATDSRCNTGVHQSRDTKPSAKKLKLPLSTGASRNIASANAGETPLVWAVNHGDAESVQELIKAGASIDPVNCQPGVKLHMALLQKDWDTVKSLLEAGAPTDFVNIRKESPLMLAIASERIELVQQLIDAGADVNYFNDQEIGCDGFKSPLHDAVRKCNVDIVKLLLERGADPNIANTRRYYSALSIATRIKENRIPILNLLLNHGADMYYSGFCLGALYDGINELPFEGMLENNDLEGVRLFLQRGFDLEKYQTRSEYCHSSSPLHVAMKIRSDNWDGGFNIPDTRMLSLLLEHYKAKGTLSAELQRGLERSCSPLFCATEITYKHTALILEAGADPNLKDRFGRTALDYVLFHDTNLRYRVIKTLIEFGAHLRNFIKVLLDQVNALNPQVNRISFLNAEGSSDSDGWDSDDADRDFNPKQRQRFIHRHSLRAQRAMYKAMCIVKYRVLYEKQNKVDDPVYPMIKNCEILRKYHEACEKEIDFLRRKKFDKSVTYYDMFMDNEFWRPPTSPDVLEEALSEFSSQYSSISCGLQIYEDDLEAHWESGYDKYKLWKPAMKGLARLLGLNEDSYYLILSNILNRLDTEDWRNLCDNPEEKRSVYYRL